MKKYLASVGKVFSLNRPIADRRSLMNKLVVGVLACLLVGGAACNGFKAGEPTSRPGERLTKWISERTPDEMRQTYREGIEYLATANPNVRTYGKLSFKTPQAASTTLKMFEKHPEIKVTAIYADSGGDSRVNELSGDTLKAAFDKEYQDILWLTQRAIESQAKWCKERPDLCTPEAARRYTDGLAEEKAKGQLYLGGLGIVGPASELKKFWDSTPEVFMILIQDGYVPGNPIYPDTNMREWR